MATGTINKYTLTKQIRVICKASTTIPGHTFVDVDFAANFDGFDVKAVIVNDYHYIGSMIAISAWYKNSTTIGARIFNLSDSSASIGTNASLDVILLG